VPRFQTRPRGPFSLGVSNRYFGGWAALGGDERQLVMTFPVERPDWSTSAAVVVAQSADGLVSGEVHGATAEDADAAWRQVEAALSLDFDGSDYPTVGERDPVIGRLQREHDMLRPVCFYSPYEAACSFVIGHRISIAQTRALRTRLAQEHGDGVNVDGETYHAFPRPQVLLELEAFGPMVGEKMARLHGIAEASLAGRLDRARLREMPIDEALRDVRSLRGVGEWIAQGIVLRGAGVADEVPDDDITRQAVQQAYGLHALPRQAEVLQRAEAWRPYRMWATVLLHVSLRRSGESFRPTGRGGVRGGRGSRR
jgi:DNA-3-methyladenine glycosylase II